MYNIFNKKQMKRYLPTLILVFFTSLTALAETTPSDSNDAQSQNSSESSRLTIEDLTSGRYSPKGVDMSEVLPGEKDKARLKATDREQIYRRSFRACYTYDGISVANGEKIEQPLVNPNGKNIVYVKDNNLYIEDISALSTQRVPGSKFQVPSVQENVVQGVQNVQGVQAPSLGREGRGGSSPPFKGGLERVCDTLEPGAIELKTSVSKEKVMESLKMALPHKPFAIPEGTYKVTLTYSPKFSRLLPLITGDKHFNTIFQGIRIHAGNDSEDTKGCILVGENKIKGKVINSLSTLNRLIDRLQKAENIKLVIY